MQIFKESIDKIPEDLALEELVDYLLMVNG